MCINCIGAGHVQEQGIKNSFIVSYLAQPQAHQQVLAKAVRIGTWTKPESVVTALLSLVQVSYKSRSHGVIVQHPSLWGVLLTHLSVRGHIQHVQQLN